MAGPPPQQLQSRMPDCQVMWVLPFVTVYAQKAIVKFIFRFRNMIQLNQKQALGSPAAMF